MSLYASSKFAVEGFTESLAAEYADFGIKCLIVEPGPFRTDFASGIQVKPMSSFYKGTAAEGVIEHISNEGGKQPGDPKKAAQIIYDVARSRQHDTTSYLRLPLGKLAVQAAAKKVEDLNENFEATRKLAESADFAQDLLADPKPLPFGSTKTQIFFIAALRFCCFISTPCTSMRRTTRSLAHF